MSHASTECEDERVDFQKRNASVRPTSGTIEGDQPSSFRARSDVKGLSFVSMLRVPAA